MAVRTETVEVKVPVLVALDPALLVPCSQPSLPEGQLVVEDLFEFLEGYKIALTACNLQLESIQALQPRE